MSGECPTYPRAEITRGQIAKGSLERADELEMLAHRLDVLADASRLKVLHLLHVCGEMCVCELQDALGMTAPNLSFHLQVLRLAGFVRSRKQGKWVFYRVLAREPRGMASAIAALFAGEPPEAEPLVSPRCDDKSEEE